MLATSDGEGVGAAGNGVASACWAGCGVTCACWGACVVWVVSALIRTLAASEAGSEEAVLVWLDEREAVCTGAGLAGSVVAAGSGVGAGVEGAALLLASGAGVLMLLSGAIAICCGGVTGTVLGTALSATTGLVE